MYKLTVTNRKAPPTSKYFLAIQKYLLTMLIGGVKMKLAVSNG